MCIVCGLQDWQLESPVCQLNKVYRGEKFIKDRLSLKAATYPDADRQLYAFLLTCMCVFRLRWCTACSPQCPQNDQRHLRSQSLHCFRSWRCPAEFDSGLERTAHRPQAGRQDRFPTPTPAPAKKKKKKHRLKQNLSQTHWHLIQCSFLTYTFYRGTAGLIRFKCTLSFFFLSGQLKNGSIWASPSFRFVRTDKCMPSLCLRHSLQTQNSLCPCLPTSLPSLCLTAEEANTPPVLYKFTQERRSELNCWTLWPALQLHLSSSMMHALPSLPQLLFLILYSLMWNELFFVEVDHFSVLMNAE